MGTILWLCFSTFLGYLIGDHWWQESVVGSFVGFFIGVIIRCGVSSIDGFDFIDLDFSSSGSSDGGDFGGGSD